MSARSRYLVGPVYDWLFFLLPPSLSLLLGVVIAGSPMANPDRVVVGTRSTLAGLGLGVIVHAHLISVVFRSHLDETIFRKHPIRFTVVPIALFAGLVLSEFLAVLSLTVATIWDVYHSGAQTFGLGRIYDRNRGAPPELGRRLDFAMNQLLYAGPILAGVSLTDHLVELREFESVDGAAAAFLASVPTRVLGHSRTIAFAVVVAGVAFLAYYVVAYVRLARRGYPVSFEKTFLLVSTGLCSIVSWGFDTWGEAFFVMNLFHAVQYLALVYARERETIARRLRLLGRRFERAIVFVVFFGSVLGYGLATELVDPDLEWFWAITMVVSLMHFWYDGFVWSVARGEI